VFFFSFFTYHVIWQDYEFIFEPSTGVRHSKFQYLCPLVRQRRRYLPNETARESYQKESGWDLPIYRANTKAGNIFPRPAGRSSIKYTPPSLDKLKRRMTVLRRRSLVMRAGVLATNGVRTGAWKAIRIWLLSNCASTFDFTIPVVSGNDYEASDIDSAFRHETRSSVISS